MHVCLCYNIMEDLDDLIRGGMGAGWVLILVKDINENLVKGRID